MDGLIPICVVDEILPIVLNDLLKSKDGGSDEKRYTFVAQSLQSNDDIYTPTIEAATASASPFLNMTFDDIHNAIQLKKETLQEKNKISQEIFIVVDARSAQDKTVWLCKIDTSHQTSWTTELEQPLKVRTHMNVAGLHGRDLQNNMTTMRKLCAWAATEQGVLGSPPHSDENKNQVDKEKQKEQDQEDEEDEDSLGSDTWSQSTSEWGDVWTGRWCN